MCSLKKFSTALLAIIKLFKEISKKFAAANNFNSDMVMTWSISHSKPKRKKKVSGNFFLFLRKEQRLEKGINMRLRYMKKKLKEI